MENERNINALLKIAIEDAKAQRQTDLAWCKCVERCMCEHCKPMKIKLARKQAREQLKKAFSKSFEARFVEALESEKYPLENEAHTLTEEVMDEIIRDLEREVTDGKGQR